MNYLQAEKLKNNLIKALDLLKEFDEQPTVFNNADQSDCLVMSILEITEFKLAALLDIFENDKTICINCESIYFFIMLGAFIEMGDTQKLSKEVVELVEKLSACFTEIASIFTEYFDSGHEHNFISNPLFTKAELN